MIFNISLHSFDILSASVNFYRNPQASMRGAVYTSSHHGNWKQLVRCHWISVCNSLPLFLTLLTLLALFMCWCATVCRNLQYALSMLSCSEALSSECLSATLSRKRQTGNQWPEWSRQECLYCLQNSHSKCCSECGPGTASGNYTDTHSYIH